MSSSRVKLLMTVDFVLYRGTVYSVPPENMDLVDSNDFVKRMESSNRQSNKIYDKQD
jgi:hypothetical protein